MNSLATQLQQIGLRAVPAGLDDFLARATKSRWSPHVLLEQLAQAEAAERSRRSLERRLRFHAAVLAGRVQSRWWGEWLGGPSIRPSSFEVLRDELDQ